MCAPTDKVLVRAEWLIGGPAHCDFIGRTLVQEVSKLPPWRQRKYRHWWTTADGFIELDACLADEVLWLNGLGVKTYACCCGHADEYTLNRYIALEDGDHAGAAKMRSLGYERRRIQLVGARVEPFVFLPRSA